MAKFSNAEMGAALLGVATVMIQKNCCAAAAAANEHDAQRIEIMSKNGVDLQRAAQLVDVDLSILIDTDE